MYLGLSPFDAPATYSLLQYTELAGGMRYPLGANTLKTPCFSPFWQRDRFTPVNKVRAALPCGVMTLIARADDIVHFRP